MTSAASPGDAGNRRANLILLAIALLSVIGHCLVNNRYGFHRDELQMIDDAQHLAWGYVIYPPVTPFIARVAFTLFGDSLVGLRLFSALGFAASIVLGGLMARELGARRWGQALAATAVAIAPVPLHNASLFQYVTFDYLAWVLVAYFALKLCRSGDQRWWLGIGAASAFGMLSKYTIGVLIVGVVVGVVLTRRRGDLRQRWLWLGALLSVLIFLPNLLWQVQHHFVSLEGLSNIHARDVEEGRGNGFLPSQLLVGANIVTLPLWMAGLWFYLFSNRGREYRLLGWLYVVPLILLFLMHGRSYYLAAAYPMLLAAGSCWWSEKLATFDRKWRLTAATATVLLLLLGAGAMVEMLMPVTRINSPLWQRANKLTDDYAEVIGWGELVRSVAQVYHTQPGGNVVILCGNYGEAGAIDLYRAAYQLPGAISGVNSYWERGYGETPPDTVVLVGFSRHRAEKFFYDPVLAGHIGNSYGIVNEESQYHPDIFVCHRPRLPWPQLWLELRGFG